MRSEDVENLLEMGTTLFDTDTVLYLSIHSTVQNHNLILRVSTLLQHES